MMRAAASRLTLALLCTAFAFADASAQGQALTIVNAGPQGPLESLAQANEIRIVFSEPMVTLGRIPDVVTAPYVRIAPAIPGSFRWSGTTILIFTPDPQKPLAYATTYQVTVRNSATAVSGRKLAESETFSFTTPTVKLLRTHWYRRDSTVNSPLVVLLRFNQAVRPQDVAAHLKATLERHDWEPPTFSPAEQARLTAMDAGALQAFHVKVNATRQIASSEAPVALRLTTDWDQQRFPPSPDLVAFEAVSVVHPESWVRLVVDEKLPSRGGPATPGQIQTFTIKAEPAFFINGFWCRDECDGEGWNPIRMRSRVHVSEFTEAIRATNISSGEREVQKPATPRPRPDYRPDEDDELTIEDAGFDAQPPDSTYVVTASATLESSDGQTLGYPWLGIVRNWHARAFTSFGDGHGVWEKDGGAQLPFYARNLLNVRQWAWKVEPGELMRRVMELQNSGFRTAPPTDGAERKLGVTADRIQSHGLNLSSALNANGTGLVWAAVHEGETLPRTRRVSDVQRTTASLVQVTNLGISVKDSPHNTLVFVTRLDTGAPVDGANVSIVRKDTNTYWRGKTGADGVAMAPDTPLRDPDDIWEFAFIVMAEKDGDVAYVGSDWNEGISPWEFGTGVNLHEREPLLRGSVFADRGVYRLGEEVHLKAILRHNAPTGIRLLPEGTPVMMSIRDTRDRLIDERVVKTTPWSSAEWTVTLPEDGALGNYSLRAILEKDAPAAKTPDEQPPGVTPSPRFDREVRGEHAVHGSFLVAAYRRPDFRVDVSLLSGGAIAGDKLKGVVTGRYLFGAPMGPRPVTWRFSRSPRFDAPDAITDKYGPDRWVFVGWSEELRGASGDLQRQETELQKSGELPLSLDTTRAAGIPFVYSLEGDVEDVSRQHIANRASLVVHPAPWYVGVQRPSSYFVEQKAGFKTSVIAVGINGAVAPGVPVDVTLTQIQWNSVRRAEGNGFYTWDTERKETEVGEWTVTTGADPVPIDISFESGGYYVLEARGKGDNGRFAFTTTSFYVLGDGYTAWARYDHNRIDLVPERQTWRPGEQARIMIQSPWEQATALVTTEREGIRSHHQFALTSTQQSVSVPISDEDIPNVFVSVLLVKGRSNPVSSGDAPDSKAEADSSDPGKPSFRMGYVELKVEDRTKRLGVTVTANQEEYRPAAKANVMLNVVDHEGRGTASEVTLWAVDYGVLSLTGYQAPDVADSVYVRKALQVLNSDSRQRIISRRVLTPKGATDGGDGGGGEGPGADVRKDFRVLAFWVGSVVTGADGKASVDVTLPESLTTYRIMAVAADRASRFGSGDTEVRTNKPLTMKPTFPRFLAVGDTALFGAVVGSQLKTDGTAVVTIKSLDPSVFELTGPAEQRVEVVAGRTVEVRFAGAAKMVGRARIQMRAQIGDESDAFEDVLPVEILSSPETVAAYGEAAGTTTSAKETLTIPSGVVPGFGGLSVELSSTAMVGLGEGARYLVEYPYGCAEQKSSRSLALLLAADLGDAFSLPGMDPKTMRPVAQTNLKELEKFQCESGGFAYWPGMCQTVSPYLTAYILHVFKNAVDLKYDIDPGVRERAYEWLDGELDAREPDVNEGWWPAYTAWQAFAVKVLVEGGYNEDSHLTRLYGYRTRMPVFAMAYMHDALLAKGEVTGDRVEDLRRRMLNAILPEGGSAHVGELADPYLLYFWNSNVRSTAIVLNAFVKAGVTNAPIRQIVRWLMQVRKDGRWGNTQENALAMEALVNYYRRFESTIPNFSAVVTLGAQELAREEFRGRSANAETTAIAMPQILTAGAAGTNVPLTFTRNGEGTLFYATRFRYASTQLYQTGLDAGFNIERRYEPYVEQGTRPAATSYAAGDLVRVTLTFRLTKERRFVAVTDPLPAGFEAVESWFSTTARDLAQQQDAQANNGGDADDWMNWWRFSGFDHVERHDDRVTLFATRLGEGLHTFSYIVRATTAGRFRTAPAHAEEMYEPEVFGRTATTVIEVKR